MPTPRELIEAAELTDDPSVRRKVLESAIEKLTARSVTTADDAYSLGYAWYLMPDDATERQAKAQQYLLVALQSMPQHLYARLYLAHCYFDTERYSDALSLLSSFGADDFARRGQAWRDVKVAELALVCVLELHRGVQVLKAVQELLERVNRVDADSLPVPLELTTTLQRLLAGGCH